MTTERRQGNRAQLQRQAMVAGTYMGVFWLAKFVLFPLGVTRSPLMLLFVALTVAVPFVGHRLGRVYRDHALGGGMTWGHAFSFCLMMYLYASMLVAPGHWVYFRFMDHGRLIEGYQALVDEALAAAPDAGLYGSQLQTFIDAFRQFSPIDITLQLLSQNMFYGLLLSLATALFLRRRAGT